MWVRVVVRRGSVIPEAHIGNTRISPGHLNWKLVLVAGCSNFIINPIYLLLCYNQIFIQYNTHRKSDIFKFKLKLNGLLFPSTEIFDFSYDYNWAAAMDRLDAQLIQLPLWCFGSSLRLFISKILLMLAMDVKIFSKVNFVGWIILLLS